MRIAVIGQGYVGLPLAIAAAGVGHSVVGIDLNQQLVDDLNLSRSRIADISDAQISSVSKFYRATTSFSEMRDAEVIVICVPTPLTTDYQPDLTPLKNAVDYVSNNFSDGSLIILESTVSPGTTRDLVLKILNESKNNFLLAYSPERIDPSNAYWNVKNTPKLVAGINTESQIKATEFYESFVETVIKCESIEVVETAKLLENTFRLINISFMSEVAEFCHNLNIDVREVIEAASSKPYGFMPFYPGVGVGGHCIPVDPAYLTFKANEIGVSMSMTDLANKINRKLPEYFSRVAFEKIGDLKDKKILIVGIAYKANVSDTRESMAISLISHLRGQGASVSWHDEKVLNWNNEHSSEISNNYDLIILANPHSDIDLTGLIGSKVLDTKGGY